MMNLLDILFGKWIPPEIEGRKHTLMNAVIRKRKEPVHARTKILAALEDKGDWMTNKELALLTALPLNTVQTTTNKLFNKDKIDRTTKKEVCDIKPICLYRTKQ